MKSSRRAAGTLTLLATLLATTPATACPSCKEAVASQNSDAARLSSGFSYSILLMIAMPIALMGTGAFALARASKRGTLPPL
jgi:hypothetical protein